MVLRLVDTVVLNDVVVLLDVLREAAAEVVTVVLREVENVVVHEVVNVVVVFRDVLMLVWSSVSTFVENSFTLLKPNRIIIENYQCN